MRSFRLTHLVTICAALALLATQNHQSTARSTSDRARYHGSGLDTHGGIEGILVNAFAYTPFAGRDLDMPQAASFVVTYTGFTPQAQAAFQRAVDIWAAILSSPVTIHVDASFVNLSGGTLGQAGTNFVRGNFTGAPVPNTWFPDAVADRLAGVDLGPTQRPDIFAEFDSTPGAPWYFGLDAQPPAGTFDFVTVVLHELGHGLGFFGSGTLTSGGLGTWGVQGFPTIYDRFVRAASVPIISVPPPSSLLATAYTSNNLFFQSPPTVTITGTAISSPAKLFAPSTFLQGSSYSHLDEATYPAGSPSSLMTPGIGMAEAQHNPGPIALEIFTDTGWGATGGQAPGYSDRYQRVGLTGRPLDRDVDIRRGRGTDGAQRPVPAGRSRPRDSTPRSEHDVYVQPAASRSDRDILGSCPGAQWRRGQRILAIVQLHDWDVSARSANGDVCRCNRWSTDGQLDLGRWSDTDRPPTRLLAGWCASRERHRRGSDELQRECRGNPRDIRGSSHRIQWNNTGAAIYTLRLYARSGVHRANSTGRERGHRQRHCHRQLGASGGRDWVHRVGRHDRGRDGFVPANQRRSDDQRWCERTASRVPGVCSRDRSQRLQPAGPANRLPAPVT